VQGNGRRPGWPTPHKLARYTDANSYCFYRNRNFNYKCVLTLLNLKITPYSQWAEKSTVTSSRHYLKRDRKDIRVLRILSLRLHNNRRSKSLVSYIEAFTAYLIRRMNLQLHCKATPDRALHCPAKQSSHATSGLQETMLTLWFTAPSPNPNPNTNPSRSNHGPTSQCTAPN